MLNPQRIHEMGLDVSDMADAIGHAIDAIYETPTKEAQILVSKLSDLLESFEEWSEE